MPVPEFVNLRHLHAIAEIARQRSTRRAANVVHLSQPALTQALAQIEATLGQRLFERTGSGMTPTPAAQLLVEHIDRAFAWLSAAERLFPGGPPLHRLVTRIQLQALMAAVDSDSISFAARRLGVRQPSVTRALRDLETICGRRLLNRSPQGIAATRDARELARHAGLAFAEIQQGMDAFRESHGQIDGRIIVGSLPLARSALVPTAITRLLQRYPEVKLKLVDGPYAELLHELRSGQMDFIVGALRNPPPADVRQEPLFSDSLSIVVRPGHPLRQKRTLAAADLGGLDWVLAPDGAPARRQFELYCQSLGLPLPCHVIECSSLIAVRSLLLQSDRAAVLSLAQVGYEVGSGQLAVLGSPLPQTARPIGLALRADWRPTVAQATFLDLLRQVVAESVAA
jgi:LysR family transcriptional regulator of gallate degradation